MTGHTSFINSGRLNPLAIPRDIADEEFGRDGGFLDALESRGQRYLMEVPANTTVWLSRPMHQTPDVYVWPVDLLVMGLSTTAWHVIKLREGAKGPLAFEFARVRVWSVRHRHAGPPLWLLIRRSLERVPEVKYYLSTAEIKTPLETMALVTGSRFGCSDRRFRRAPDLPGQGGCLMGSAMC